MARPKIEEDKKRGAWLGLRLTADEREQIDSAAAKVGLSPSEYGRRCALRGTVRVVSDERKHDPELLRSLLAIGNNLNQIARKLNATDQVPANLTDTLDTFAAFMKAHLPPPREDGT